MLEHGDIMLGASISTFRAHRPPGSDTFPHGIDTSGLKVRPVLKKFRHTGIPGLWTQELDAGFWTLDSRHWTLDPGIWTLDSGRWTLDAGLWTLDSGRWTLDSGRWTLDAGLWTLDSGRWTLDATC